MPNVWVQESAPDVREWGIRVERVGAGVHVIRALSHMLCLRRIPML